MFTTIKLKFPKRAIPYKQRDFIGGGPSRIRTKDTIFSAYFRTIIIIMDKRREYMREYMRKRRAAGIDDRKAESRKNYENNKERYAEKRDKFRAKFKEENGIEYSTYLARKKREKEELDAIDDLIGGSL